MTSNNAILFTQEQIKQKIEFNVTHKKDTTSEKYLFRFHQIRSFEKVLKFLLP